MMLAGGDLDRAVHEQVFGLRVDHEEDGRGQLVTWLDANGWRIPPKQYSTDIRDAWEVALALLARGFRPVLTPTWQGEWHVVVYRKSDFICQSGFYDTAPLAICDAALCLMEWESRHKDGG